MFAKDERVISRDEYEKAEMFKNQLLKLHPEARKMFYDMLKGGLAISELYQQKQQSISQEQKPA